MNCTFTSDGTCDDGGAGSVYALCDYGHDCDDCGTRTWDSAICQNGGDGVSNCSYAYDGLCDDGGAGSDYGECTFGHDCADCGTRADSQPTPTPVPTPASNASGVCQDGGDGISHNQGKKIGP